MAQAEPGALPLLAEVAGWGPERCRRQLPAALPRLLSVYQVTENWAHLICVLRTITERFLPHLNISELEQAFFSKILPKTVQLFDLLTYEISSQAKQLTKQNVELHETLRNHLQALVHVLEALTGCVRHICAAQETVPLEHVHSLPSSVLHVIKSAFMHCKNSESLYNDCLHLFSDLLQTLFKEGYALQKQLMELLEMVSVDSCTAEDSAAVMVSVIHSVLEICSAISRIDHALHANTWKFIIRQSLKHKSLIKNSLKHSDIFSSLCEDILFYFQSCLQLAEQMKRSGTQENTDYKLFQRTIKLCRFFANSLAHYTKEFTPFLADSCPQLHRTYLEIYSKLPPSLHAPVISEAHQDEIAKGFLVVLDSLLPKLLSSRPFLEVVLSTTLDLAPELHLPQCRLLLSVMDLLPSQPQDVQALWNAGSRLPQAFPRWPLLAALFLSLRHCCGELVLPFLPGAEQADGPVTFYHYTCVHLCAFITSLPESHFHLLEHSLLEMVLGPNAMTALLAMDTWCFLARYGTADLCAHHAFIVASLLKACPAEHHQVSVLGVLLRRLLFLMAAEHQAAFTQNFSPKDAENLPLWQHLSLLALVPVLRQQVAHELFAAGLGQCQEWLSSERLTEELPRVNAALAALLSACQTAGEALEEGQRATLVDTLRQLLGALPPAQVSSLPCLQQAFCGTLCLLQLFIQMLEPQLLIQILALQVSLLQLNPPDHLLMATLDFLSSMGKAIIPPNFQEQVLPKLSCLFSSLLASGSWLIQQHAVEAFTQFAEGTSHENLLPQCLNNEEIKSTVVRFLSKDYHIDETAEARAERMKDEDALLRCRLQEVSADRQRALILQPSPERAHSSSPREAEYKSAVDTAEEMLELMKQLLQKGPPPPWLARKLAAMQSTLDTLRSRVC
ncbi:uncharacterized protein C1orf112 homolog [Varanus komodoensis]|uniref:uncharacterized protein C1orf112 homolog n=1 Tax=Varanus komodoensis TaxID=61221 RepID=UPI001CF76BAA|nr:uncharacterized protein C1orf112 homolog [Varanus komodoensis]